MKNPPPPSHISNSHGLDNFLTHMEPPIDLWNTVGPPELPMNLLPKIIEDFAFVLGRHMGASVSGLAMAALTVAAAAIPDRVRLQPKVYDTKWTESARIWTMLIGGPSTKKSPILAAAIRPLAKIDGQMLREWKQAHARWSALSKEDRHSNPEPIQLRLRIEDTTIEAAQEILMVNVDGILCAQDEMSGWFGSMERYGSSRSSSVDRSFWLRAYSGGEYALNRVGRGSKLIENLSISLLGGVQPEPIRKIASEAVDDGLLQRMFPITLSYGAVGNDAPIPPVQQIYDTLIHALRHVCTTNTPLRFDPEAQSLRQSREERHVTLMNVEMFSKQFASHLGKMDGMFARLFKVGYLTI